MEDQNRFDDLTRTLATSTSRRQALKLLGGSLMGSFLGFSGLDTVFAKPKPCTANGKHCTSKTTCCSGFCDSTTKKCTACPSRCQVLANGTCAQFCTGVPDSCTCGGSGGSVCAGDSSSPTGGVCSPNGAINTGTCTSDINCPPGYFCNTNFGPP